MRTRFLTGAWCCSRDRVGAVLGVVLSITGSDIITPLSPRGQIDKCKNIATPQTSFAGGNISETFV